jgi:ubiquinone/menaquinone biosynthesis C-methylase UbiE
MRNPAEYPSSLRAGQYHTDANLRARVGLHQRFSTNPHGWYRWMWDQLDLPTDASVLEVGCGTGDLWAANTGRVPASWRLVLSDLSLGMLSAALDQVCVPGVVADAAALPMPDECLDAVIANHMLYHVSDRQRTLAEIRRVLRPGGRLYAATNGRAHMAELRELLGERGWSDAESFGLETGPAQLAAWFATVTVRRYLDALEVTKVEPLLAYACSMAGLTVAHPAGLGRLEAAAVAAIRTRGAFHITKDVGLVIGQVAA